MALVFMEFYKVRRQSQFSVLMKRGIRYKKKKKTKKQKKTPNFKNLDLQKENLTQL